MLPTNTSPESPTWVQRLALLLQMHWFLSNSTDAGATEAMHDNNTRMQTMAMHFAAYRMSDEYKKNFRKLKQVTLVDVLIECPMSTKKTFEN